MSPNVKSLWVFGYGSLLWAPGFAFTDAVEGVVHGYARRFWQGNATHRGTPSQENVWGVAYELCGEDAIAYLNNREVTLGGYVTKFSKFYPTVGGDPFPVLLYIATDESVHWLGRAPEDEIAEQVVSCSGSSGHNVEYVLRLANYVRDHAPDVRDEHLFTLEAFVRKRIAEKSLNLDLLMGPPVPKALPVSSPEDEETAAMPPLNFIDLMDNSKLRCLGI
uniref:glutathione-specific gamma-glutamylcyclotransferase n=1 Tax=Lygus hesperus TaxID=30085 RepID=A0A146LXE1_LYGHE